MKVNEVKNTKESRIKSDAEEGKYIMQAGCHNCGRHNGWHQILKGTASQHYFIDQPCVECGCCTLHGFF